MNTGANYYLIWELAGAELRLPPLGNGFTYFRGDGGAYGYFCLFVDVWRNGNGDYEYRECT